MPEKRLSRAPNSYCPVRLSTFSTCRRAAPHHSCSSLTSVATGVRYLRGEYMLGTAATGASPNISRI